MEKCKWKYDEIHDVYTTGCNDAFTLESGNLEENNMKYCPFCGNIIEQQS